MLQLVVVVVMVVVVVVGMVAQGKIIGLCGGEERCRAARSDVSLVSTSATGYSRMACVGLLAMRQVRLGQDRIMCSSPLTSTTPRKHTVESLQVTVAQSHTSQSN
ncbi:hypothetical protein E2C01_021904 [Portunus trituberculatus]|uniref:Secreted protein n=1 Tax=Portunus trituberculatus TaxID=210409 RepID=A0A5B7E7H7_PORTR|nr:hypothetical protein [Portunus trituberculatus]